MAKSTAELASRFLPDVEIGEAEKFVLERLLSRQTLSRNINAHLARDATFGQRLADKIARIGGSWGFILGFLTLLLTWVAINGWLLSREAFDPYPFIFLNLLLSMLAAVQAPIIMMAQNRQATRDRIDAAHDYEINLKAEIEIMALHEKIDALRHSELMAMRSELTAVSSALERLETRLAGGSTPQ